MPPDRAVTSPRVEPADLEGEPTLRVTVGTTTLEVALLGATPLRWLVELDGAQHDLLDGYRDAAELLAQGGVRNGVMAPFCNRVAGGRYTFDGVEHDLAPGAPDGMVYHGLTRTLPFVVESVEADDEEAHITFRCTGLRGGSATGYPFDVDVEAAFWVTAASLRVEVTGTNRGNRAAPFAAGWHPYFRLPGATCIDRWHVRVPARARVRTGSTLLPLAGSAALEAVGPGGVAWEPLGVAAVDDAFGELVCGPDGVARSTVRDPVTGVELVLWQSGGLVHVFTGDTLDRDRRASLAVEPVEAMTDAFNRPDCADALRLEPGTRRSFTFGVAVSSGTSDYIPAGAMSTKRA